MTNEVELAQIELIDQELMRLKLRAAMRKALTFLERTILELKFGMAGEPCTTKEISEFLKFKVTKVYQIQSRAFRKMCHPKNSRHLRDFFEEWGGHISGLTYQFLEQEYERGSKSDLYNLKPEVFKYVEVSPLYIWVEDIQKSKEFNRKIMVHLKIERSRRVSSS